MSQDNIKTVRRIAAVGDIHIKESDQGKWKDCFQAVSEKADVLLLCGDLTDTGKKKEAKVLAEELTACTIPVVAVLGNHDYENDQQDDIRQVLSSSNFHLLDGESIVIGNVGFAGVKGFGGGFDRFMMPMFGEKMNKEYVRAATEESLRLDQALVRLDKQGQEGEDIKKIVLLHYAPIKATVEGEPAELFPFLGSSHLVEPLERRQVLAAFHGHAHSGSLQGETNAGVKVYNVAKPILVREGYSFPFFIFEME
ncbi:MAG TPA: metallophosphoesterase [Cyclobacteriaceae bacterium]|nr:metallophosphoesterase [Cyclobacteriaceae bacterium]